MTLSADRDAKSSPMLASSGCQYLHGSASACLPMLEEICEQAVADTRSPVDRYLEHSPETGTQFVRRIERFVDDDGQLASALRKTLLPVLEDCLSTHLTMMKDKINFKAPGGGGYRAHLDGHFRWTNSQQQTMQGWLPYGKNFWTACIAIDAMTKENGPLELAPLDRRGNLLGETWEERMSVIDGKGPYLREEIESRLSYDMVSIAPGDVVIFDWRVAHRSFKNNSRRSRRAAFLTFADSDDGDIRTKYYADKQESKTDPAQKALN